MKLIADGMLGRLARWLRILGYDTLYAPAWEDNELVRRARAEGRLLLTRDTALAQRRGIQSLLVEAQTLPAQLREVVDKLGLQAESLFSRCSLCNLPLEGISKDAAQSRVPPYVFATQEHFHRCPGCGRIYWRGTHWQGMRKLLDEIAHDR